MNRVGRSLLAVTSGPRRPPATVTRGRTAGYTYLGTAPRQDRPTYAPARP